jgi:hypothetical protein
LGIAIEIRGHDAQDRIGGYKNASLGRFRVENEHAQQRAEEEGAGPRQGPGTNHYEHSRGVSRKDGQPQ